MKKHAFYWLALGLLFMVGCQKELSFELGNTPSKGSLQSDVTGDCLPKTVNGVYTAGMALVPVTNTITVSVNVARTGTYLVYTDTVNGYFFRATGTFTTLGATNVTLRGNGTPFIAGTDNFIVSYDSSICDIQVVVTSPGVGTLAGSPTACAPIQVNGGYSPGVALTAGNNAVVQVNVTTAGVFNFTTDTVAGIWFNFSGVLPLGPQSVTMQAQGSIPAATIAGNKTFTVKLGMSSCTFVVNVVSPAVGTVNCGSATFAGSYNAGVAMTASNTVTISVTITTPGAYNITTDTMNGVWFNASGNFPTATTTPLVLTGNGTPVTAGPFIYTVKWGTSTCTFTCTYSAAPAIDYFPRTTNSNWSYEWNDDNTDSVLRVVIPATLSAPPNTYNIFMPDEGFGPDTSATSSYSAGYYRKNGGDYFERFNGENFFGFDAPVWGEYIMLKDNVAAPSPVWTSAGFSGAIGGTPIKIRFSYKVLQKDVPITFTTSGGPMNFTNVIVVEEKYEIETLPGVWTDATPIIGYGKSYYARNIGLILFEVFDPSNTRTDWQELRRYQVF
jgi:hypothetical protein